MANLIIDIGNTAVKASWSDGMTLGKTFRYQGEKAVDFILSLVGKEKPKVMVVASVYEISAADQSRLSKVCNRLLLLDGAHPDLLASKGLPAHLTYDRAASILAARYLFRGRGCTVVDFGTTLTVDMTDAFQGAEPLFPGASAGQCSGGSTGLWPVLYRFALGWRRFGHNV